MRFQAFCFLVSSLNYTKITLFPPWHQFNRTSFYCIVYVPWGLVCFLSGTTSGREGGGLGEMTGSFWKLGNLRRQVELRYAHTCNR